MRITKETKIPYKRARYLAIFLKERGLYQKYMSYLIKDKNQGDHHKIQDTKNRMSLLRAMDLYGLIGAFNWSRTPEGWTFWNNLDKEFSITLKQLIIK